jgi:uncharacterized YigZ family protein
VKTIKNYGVNEIIIKNSRFITILSIINNINDVDDCLMKLKKEYKNATHYCYAYIINDIKRSNDDGEPSGTAGVPILEVLSKNDLNYVLCVVIRYFGGIKLGAGGLIRAYSKSVREALLKSASGDINKGYEIIIEFSYDDLKNIDYILNNAVAVKKDFNEKIRYIIRLKEEEIEILDKLEMAKAQIIKKEETYFLE